MSIGARFLLLALAVLGVCTPSTTVGAGTPTVLSSLRGAEATSASKQRRTRGPRRAAITGLASLPRLEESNLTYLGAFKLPLDVVNGSAFGDVGRGLAYRSPAEGGPSLFVTGIRQVGKMAEVTIPTPLTGAIAGLNRATRLQNDYDPSDGRYALIAEGGGDKNFGGFLISGSELLSTAYYAYDTSGLQQISHMRAGLTLSVPDDTTGPFTVSGDINAGFVSGYMGHIPTEFQTVLDGDTLTGQAVGISIITRTSFGPSAASFWLSDLGTPGLLANRLVAYPVETHNTLAQLQGTWQASPSWGYQVNGPYVGAASQISGIAFPRNTRSVLFFGTNGNPTSGVPGGYGLRLSQYLESLTWAADYPNSTHPYWTDQAYWTALYNVDPITYAESQYVKYGAYGPGHCYGTGTATLPIPAEHLVDPELPFNTSTNPIVNYCYDPNVTAKGDKAYPRSFQVWEYDALDLAAVKASTMSYWEPIPEIWTFDLPYTTGIFQEIIGVTHDDANGIIYMSVVSTEVPGASQIVIHVFQVTGI